MIFQSKLINGIRQGTTTKTVRPALPSHPKTGPWKVGDVLPVKATMNGDTLFRIEVQDVELTTIGKLELADIRAAGFKHRDLFIEAWKTQTGTVNPPSLHKLVWLVTFTTVSLERYLAQREPRDLSVRVGDEIRQVVPVADEHGYVNNRSSALDDADEQIGVLPCLSEHEQRAMSREKVEEWNRRRAPELALREIDAMVGRLRRIRSTVEMAAGRRSLVSRVEARAKGTDETEEDKVMIDLLKTAARLNAQITALERDAKAA